MITVTLKIEPAHVKFFDNECTKQSSLQEMKKKIM